MLSHDIYYSLKSIDFHLFEKSCSSFKANSPPNPNSEIIKDIDGRPVPVELISGGVPSAISEIEWDPQKYMAEHLNMGYDEPRFIKVRIKNTDYNILQHWFGGNYRKLVNRSDERYDVVEIKTSPSLIVSWALSYGEKVEILDADIRNEIKKQLNKLKEMYKD